MVTAGEPTDRAGLSDEAMSLRIPTVGGGFLKAHSKPPRQGNGGRAFQRESIPGRGWDAPRS